MKIQYGIQWFSQTSFGNLVALMGLVLAVILFLKSKDIVRLSAQFKSIPLINYDSQGLSGDIEIKYKGFAIPRLTFVQIYLWNTGNQTIEANRIVDGDRLQIFFSKDTKIIKAEIAAETRKVNKSSVKISDAGNSALINFLFFDPGDGIRIDILHTGEELFPSFGGTIKGIPKGVEIVSKRSQISTKMPSDWLSLISLDYYLFFSLIGFIMGLIPYGIGKKFFSNDGITMNQYRTWQLYFVTIGLVVFLLWFWRLYYSPALDHYPGSLETNSKSII